MKEYLSYQFDRENKELVSAYDELPLWSAPFGLKLLEKVKLRPGLRMLDVGCGTGFPLIEIAQRLGGTASCWGIDPWMQALRRIQMKVSVMGMKYLNLACGRAEEMPFRDEVFDLIVSNNGINNVADPRRAIEECGRVCAREGQFVMTMNMRGTMRAFYRVFQEVLEETGVEGAEERINEHVGEKRMDVETLIRLLRDSHFRVDTVHTDGFLLSFVDGSAMLQYHFIKCFFLEAWKGLVEQKSVGDVFGVLEERLNRKAEEEGGLKLTVPFICLDCSRE